MRALMFYEEQKRHRINKIKSKKYRKIQKRKREREKDAEEEGARLDGEIIVNFESGSLLVSATSFNYPSLLRTQFGQRKARERRNG